MKIEPSGVIFTGICDIQTDRCLAKQSAPITAVWATPGRLQINVCRPCLEEQIRAGEWEIPGSRIPQRADVAVYSPDRKLQLVVEVKKSSQAKSPSVDLARQIHRNLLAHAGIPRTRYFLLAILPGQFYLWKESGAPDEIGRAPDYEASTSELLKPYFDRLSVPPERASEYQLETIVNAWLQDVSGAELPLDDSLNWLQESGLYDVLKNSSVEMQAAIAA